MLLQKSDLWNKRLDASAKLFVVLLLSAYFSLFFLHKQQVTNFDYGKLVKYGEVIVQTGHVFETNLFSYTYPDYPFLNHHWCTGVIFYLVHKVAGLKGLTLLALVLNLAAFLLVIRLSSRTGNFWATVFVVLLTVPLLASRTQPRPEAFSIFFFVLTVFLLVSYDHKKLKRKYLWLLPLIQLLWINIHILFFLGIFLQGVFLFQLLINKTGKKELLFFTAVFAASVAACFINPAGAKGVFYPFMIMGEIQYGVTENMPLFSTRLMKENSTYFYYYELLFLLTGILWYYWLKNPKEARSRLYIILWSAAFVALALWRVRAGVFFAYMIVLLAGEVTGQLPSKHRKTTNRISIVMAAFLLVFVVAGRTGFFYPYRYQKPGLGIAEGLPGGARYFISNKLHGPVFNNFDVGDYLIYYLFPQERVFVDSRPEAYPPGFFKKELLPAIFRQKDWLQLDYKYNFNVVFLGYHPQVINMVKRLFIDSRWFLAYHDRYTIIFLKMNEENEPLVKDELQNRKVLNEIMRRFEENIGKGSLWEETEH